MFGGLWPKTIYKTIAEDVKGENMRKEERNAWLDRALLKVPSNTTVEETILLLLRGGLERIEELAQSTH